MDSSELLNPKEDKLASIRSRNKILIIIFFSLIIALALITGRTITSLAQQINSKPLKPDRAMAEFCSPFGFRSSACVNSISSAIHPSPQVIPNQIFLRSLQSSLSKISSIASTARSECNCSASLSHAAGQLNNIVEILRIDPDLESYDRSNMTAWIGAAADDLAACTCAAAGEVAVALGYGKDFLADCEAINLQYRSGADDSRSWEEEVVENLITVSLFGSQYLVLIFLFCLLLRIY